MIIIEQIEKEVKGKINEYKANAEDHYDFWNEHIKYVYIESQKLAEKYGADIEIVTSRRGNPRAARRVPARGLSR